MEYTCGPTWTDIGAWAAPCQTKTTIFVKLVMNPKSYNGTTDRRNFGSKPSKWRWGQVLSWKIPEFCSVGGARSQNSIFRVFRVPFDYPVHSRQETVLPQTNGKQTLRVCLLLVWRVCDQTFGRHRPRCRKVVTWPSLTLEIFILICT